MSVGKDKQTYKIQKISLKLQLIALQCKQAKYQLCDLKNIQASCTTQFQKLIKTGLNCLKVRNAKKTFQIKKSKEIDLRKTTKQLNTSFTQKNQHDDCKKKRKSLKLIKSISIQNIDLKLKELKKIEEKQNIFSLKNASLRKKNLELLTLLNTSQTIKQFTNKKSNSFILNYQKIEKRQIKILYCEAGHKYYQGETKQLLPNGKGKIVHCCFQGFLPESIQFYEGDFKNGIFDGYGIIQYRGRVLFEGVFMNGKRNGEGKIIINNKCINGKWRNDKMIT